MAPPPPAWASDADAYVQSAQTLTAKGDLKGAAIELRNAARTAPENADIHFQLAKIYLQISNLPAAEAEARIALQRGADEGKVAPILAEALLRTGKFDILLHDVPAGSRPPQQESAVRLFRGHAYLSLGQLSQAETLMRDAEQLDPNAVGPKLGVARLLLARESAASGRAEDRPGLGDQSERQPRRDQQGRHASDARRPRWRTRVS